MCGVQEESAMNVTSGGAGAGGGGKATPEMVDEALSLLDELMRALDVARKSDSRTIEASLRCRSPPSSPSRESQA